VTRDEREAFLERLQQQNAESIAAIERRIAAREADPNSELERLMADQRFTKDESDLVYSEPVGSSPPSPATILYRRYENPLPPGPEPDGDPSEFEQAVDKFAATVERALADDARELTDLRTKVATLEGKVETLTALLGQKPKLWTP
jgi:hypothetical protein